MRWLLRCLLVAVWLLVPQVASAADPVPPAPTPTVPTPVPDPPAAATPDPAASVWLTRVPQVGNWMVDGVLGSLSAVLAVFNDLQAVVYRSVLGVFGDTTACGDLGFIACTPVNFFFATDSPVGAAVQEMWRILRSVATALLTLLLTVRIGRLMIGGVGDLASEGQELTTSFAMALAVIYGAEGLLRMLIGAFNDLHAAILGDGGAVILSAIESPVFFNLANQLLRALLFIVLFLLMFKAITRILHLALLIGMAPVMGALLLDRSTSSRFGAWFGRLIETLLQQTAWVFFLKVGSVLFASIQPVLTHDQLLGLLSAVCVLTLTLGGESILAGIATSGSSLGQAQRASMVYATQTIAPIRTFAGRTVARASQLRRPARPAARPLPDAAQRASAAASKIS